MREYLIILEPGENCRGAYCPDVPGCAVTAATREDAQTLFAEALQFHLEGLALEGMPIPEPASTATTIRIAS